MLIFLLLLHVIANVIPNETSFDGPVILPSDELQMAGNVIVDWFGQENMVRTMFSSFLFDDSLNFTPFLNNSSF